MRFIVVKRIRSNAYALATKANSPYVLHQNMEEARVEASRLATVNPGSQFDVYKLEPVGTATIQAVTWRTAEEVRDTDPMP